MDEPASTSAPKTVFVSAARKKFTLTLDQKFLQKSAHDAIIRPILIKLNKPLAALERVLLNQTKLSAQALNDPVGHLLLDAACNIMVEFSETYCEQLKLNVCADDIFIKITLDNKWMRRSFRDAVVQPFLTVFNKRNASMTKAESLVEVHVDGSKVSLELASMLALPTERAIGYRCSNIDLYFSLEAIRSSNMLRPATFKWRGIYDDLSRTKELVWHHLGLNNSDGIEIAKQLNAISPLKSLKYIYLYNNRLGDQGVCALAPLLKREHAPALLQVHLNNNRIGDVGAAAIASDCNPSPDLDVMSLHDNMIGDAGASAIAQALEARRLKVGRLLLYGNPAISTSCREQLEEVCPGSEFECELPGGGPTPFIPLDHTTQRWVTASDVK